MMKWKVTAPSLVTEDICSITVKAPNAAAAESKGFTWARNCRYLDEGWLDVFLVADPAKVTVTFPRAKASRQTAPRA